MIILYTTIHDKRAPVLLGSSTLTPIAERNKDDKEMLKAAPLSNPLPS